MLLIGLKPSLANADTTCKSIESSSYLCKDDPAWYNGYLVPTGVLKELKNKINLTDTIIKERDDLKLLLDQSTELNASLKSERDDLMLLLDVSNETREELVLQRNELDVSLAELERSYNLITNQNKNYKTEIENSYAPWETWTLVGGISVGTLLLGVGVGALMWK